METSVSLLERLAGAPAAGATTTLFCARADPAHAETATIGTPMTCGSQ